MSLPKVLGSTSTTAARTPRCVSESTAVSQWSSVADVTITSVVWRPKRRCSSSSRLPSGASPTACGRGQRFEDARELLLPALRLDDAQVLAERHEADGSVVHEVVARHAGGDADAVLLGALLALPAATRRSRSRMTQMSLAGSSSNVFTINSPVRAVLLQWMRLKPSPGAYSRTPEAFGVT